jgi:phage FluMu protein Com
MPYYKCPNCKGVFKVVLFVDPAPTNPSDFPSMPCPKCGKLSLSVPYIVYAFGKKIKTK